VVCDKATFPRDKTCGDGLTTAALRSLERLGLPRSALASSWSEVTETVVVSPSGRQVVLPLPRAGTYAAVVPRVALDTALVDLARERGVDVRERAPVTDVVTDASGAKVRVADGTTFEARFVVAGGEARARRMARRSPVLQRGARRPVVDPVRTRPAPRLRMDLPAAGRPCQR